MKACKADETNVSAALHRPCGYKQLCLDFDLNPVQEGDSTAQLSQHPERCQAQAALNYCLLGNLKA